MDTSMVENVLTSIAGCMQVETKQSGDGRSFQKGFLTITAKGSVLEPIGTLDAYIESVGDPGKGLDRYMIDTDIAHTFAELVKVLDKRQKLN